MIPQSPNRVPFVERPSGADTAAGLTAAIRQLGSAKHIARLAHCSERTARRWRIGSRLPDPLRLTRLMGLSRAVLDAVLRMAGLDDASLDAREARLTQEMHADRRETLRIGGLPDVESDTLDGDDEVRRVGRHG